MRKISFSNKVENQGATYTGKAWAADFNEIKEIVNENADITTITMAVSADLVGNTLYFKNYLGQIIYQVDVSSTLASLGLVDLNDVEITMPLEEGHVLVFSQLVNKFVNKKVSHDYVQDWFEWDEDNQAIRVNHTLYSIGGLSAFGLGGSGDTPGSGNPPGSVDILSSLFERKGAGTETDPYKIEAKYDFYSIGGVSAFGLGDVGSGGSGGGGYVHPDYSVDPYTDGTLGHITTATLNSLKSLLNWFEWDEDNQAIRVKYALYSIADLSAFGVGTGSGTGSGGGYERLDDWLSYDVSKEGWVLSAGLGYGLKVMVDGKSPIGHKHTISDISNFTPYSHPDYSQENEIGGTLGHIKASKMTQIDILLSLFERKGAGTELNPYVIEAKYDFYSIGGSSAYGLGVLGGGSGGGYERLDDWASYDASKATWVLSAKLGVGLNASLAGKQAQLNGTGLVRMSGTGVNYDNTSYATVSQLSGYATTSSLSNYLLKSGGTLSDNLTIQKASGDAYTKYISGTTETFVGTDANGFFVTSGGVLRYHIQGGVHQLTGNGFTYNGYEVIHSGNLSNGYLPYWNGSSLVNSGIYTDGTLASIGQNDLWAKLSIIGGGDSMPFLGIGDSSYGWKLYERAADGDILVKANNASTLTDVFALRRANGNVGVGYTNRSEKFAVNGSGYFNGSLTNVGHHFIKGVENKIYFDSLGAENAHSIGGINSYDLRISNGSGTGSWLDLRSDGSIYTSGVFETYGHARIGFNGSSGIYIASSSRYLWPGAGGSLALGTSGIDRIYITGAGFSKMSNTGYFSNVSGSYHEILSDSSLTALISSEISSGSANILYLSFRNLSPDDNSRFLNCYSTSGSKFLLYASGRVWAANYIESASYLKGTSIKIGANWEAIPSGTSDAYLDLKHNGVLKARLDSSGNITAVGGITAFAV